MIVWERLAAIVAEHGTAALVTLHAVRGSSPREAGARMIVRPDGGFHGSVGGGRLEWEMLERAADMLARGDRAARFFDQALGPDLGQCCGGFVKLLVEVFDRNDLSALDSLMRMEKLGPFAVEAWLHQGRVVRHILSDTHPEGPTAEGRWREACGEVLTPVRLFGAGHVARALILALAPLPFATRWIDTRDDAFPAHVLGHAVKVQAKSPETEIVTAPEEAFILVMTHDHAVDLAITAAALRRPFPYVGLIGSGTKRARFERRFRELGLPEERIGALVCPVGLPGISSKEPAIIAASVTAQLLQIRESRALALPCVRRYEGFH